MKQKVKLIGLAVILSFIVTGFYKCDWPHGPEGPYNFQSFITDSYEYSFPINIITKTDTLEEIAIINTILNLDSIIKAKSDSVYNYINVGRIQLEECRLTILNPDSNNNSANFETWSLSFNSKSKTEPMILFNGTKPDIYCDTVSLLPDKIIYLNYYFKSNQQTFKILAKARRVTTKQLNCKISIKYKVI